MGKRKVLFGQEARNKIVEGVNILGKAVSSTLGPLGKAVVIQKTYGTPTSSVDGVTVANNIHLEDYEQDLGAQMVRSVANNTNLAVGDGTTTSTLLAMTLVNLGMNEVKMGKSPVLIKKQLDKARDILLDRINSMVKKVESDDELVHVATISSKDPEIGKVVANAVKEVGESGIISVKDSNKVGISSEITSGFRIADRGYISPYLTNENKDVWESENVKILIIDGKIVYMKQLLPLLTELIENNIKNLFIMADDIDAEPLQNLIFNHLQKRINCCVIKNPFLGTKKIEILTDYCVSTGATLISESTGLKLEDVKINHLGSAQKIIVRKYETEIIEPKGDKNIISQRYALLETEFKEELKKIATYDKQVYEGRLGVLGGRVLQLLIGASSEIELRDLKFKIEDAIGAVKAALKGGITAGGGLALLHAGEALLSTSSTLGEKILSEACRAPFETILNNAGEDAYEIAGEIRKKNDLYFGYDALNGKYGNMFEMGIIDPAEVIRESIKNSVSVAGMVLQTDTIITFINEEEKNRLDE